MRYLYVLFSIYMIFLSTMPCADVEVGSSAHSYSEHKTEKDQNTHDKHNDLCSPFCSCNCCGSQVLTYSQPMFFKVQSVAERIETQLPVYNSVLASNFFGSIWQPPQLV